jgi:hypothetical protein
MKIIIDTQDDIFASEFIPEVLRDYVIKNYRDVKAKKLNLYLEDFNVKQSVRTILIYAIENLKISKEGNMYTLEIDKNKNVPNTAFNLDTVVKLITYGTIDVRGYDILLKAYEFITKKMKSLKKLYLAKNKKGKGK